MFSFYYIVEHQRVPTRATTSWRVTRTEHDLDTEPGLLAFLKIVEAEFGTNAVLTYWRKLSITPTRKTHARPRIRRHR